MVVHQELSVGLAVKLCRLEPPTLITRKIFFFEIDDEIELTEMSA